MFSRGAMGMTASATATALVLLAATPSYADLNVGVGMSAGQGQVQVQGQLQVGTPQPPPPPAPPAVEVPSYPQPYPQPYPQAYPQPYPQPYQPGYAPVYPGVQVYPPAPRVPIRYELRPRTNLIIAGSIMLGAVYLTTAGIAAYADSISCSGVSSCNSVVWPLYVPLVGPFIYMGVGDRSTALYASPALVISGLAQIGGLAMIIAGAVTRHRVPVYASTPPRFSVSPYFTPTTSGLAAVGSF